MSKTVVVNEQIKPIRETYRFNTELVLLALEDLSPEDAVRRWKNGQGSSIAYLVGHVSSSRYGVLKTLGAETRNPYAELYGAGVGAKDGAAYPPLAELAAGWRQTAARLDAALHAVTDEQALRPATESYPTGDQTLRGQLAFIAWHESYHIGQIGILRTEMGYPSLRQRLSAARQAAQG